MDSSLLPAFQVKLVEQLRKIPIRHDGYNGREIVGYIAYGRLRSVPLTEPTMTANLPRSLNLAKTCGLSAVESGVNRFRIQGAVGRGLN